MQRIMIIGSAGSGKSTCARLVGTALDLPVYHMDREVYWLPGWEERPGEDRLAQVNRIVAEERWVFEGSNSRTYHIRGARADILIWLDTPLALRVWRICRRQAMYWGQSRPDMAEGCEERLSMLPEFLWFILRTWRASKEKAGTFFDAFPRPKQRFTTVSQVNAFVADLKGEAGGHQQSIPRGV